MHGALKVMENMIRKERMSKDEFCKAMPILPKSDEEKPADQAAKFSSEIVKLLKQLTNNEMSLEVIADIFSQEDGSSLLKGDAVQEQARLPAGCKEQGHPAAPDACVNQIIVEAVVKCTRENSESFAAQELEATRRLKTCIILDASQF